MSSKKTACLVTDDTDLGKSLTASFKSAGLALVCIRSAKEYLSEWGGDVSLHGCLLVDGKGNNLDLIKDLSQRNIVMPVIALVPHGAVSAAVQALKSGAVDAFEKPVKWSTLLESVHKTIALFGKLQKIIDDREIAQERIASLTPRETQVINLMAQGKRNRQIAAELGISPKTLDIHRSNLMDKMEADTVGGLCRSHLLNKLEPAYLHLLL